MNRTYALFLGCQIPARVPQYELAARAIAGRLGLGLRDVRLFNCCGYPMRNNDEKAFLLSAVKNLALAEKEGCDMLVLCKCCYGSLRTAKARMEQGGPLADEVRRRLAQEGLAYRGRVQVQHLLSVLFHEVGVETLREKVTRPFKDLKIAAHYGCHALRPSSVTAFDDPVAPTLFEALVGVTGASCVEWDLRLECCGAPALGANNAVSLELTHRKLVNAKESGADYVCTACPYCQLQFDRMQGVIAGGNGGQPHLGSILYPQLLALSMGVDPGQLGLDLHEQNISDITSYMTREE